MEKKKETPRIDPKIAEIPSLTPAIKPQEAVAPKSQTIKPLETTRAAGETK